jgi:two-component system, OmpR family, sensor histidine kinase KdpD
MSRGTLRIYLGAAPGVGKTYAMLDEGWRRAGRGTDVVIAVVETHGRRGTLAQLRDVPIVARRRYEYRGTVIDEMDVDAVLARHPRVALVDELAHTNAPGSRNEKRWQDIEELLDAGIDVITTINIQHLESLNDIVAQITGIRQRETAPDEFVRRADQIELVDMTPEALRRRMAHGNIYPSERIDAALSNYFRPGNLAALRELSLLWLADRVEENLDGYLAAHAVTGTWETRERVVVALSGIPGDETLIRRAARIAGNRRGALLGVHVVTSDGRSTPDASDLAQQRQLLADVGGTYHEVVGGDIAHTIAMFARGEKATQIIIGATTGGRWSELVRGSLPRTLLRYANDIDVHIIGTRVDDRPTPPETRRRLPRRAPSDHMSRRQRIATWALALVTLPVLTTILAANRGHLTLTTITLLYLACVIVIAALGGFAHAAASAVAASLLINWYFTPPIHTFTVSRAENLVSLAVFLALALLVSALADGVSRRSLEARRAQTESTALARTSAVLVADSDDVHLLLDQITLALNLDGAALLRPSARGWEAIAATGTAPPTSPDQGVRIELGDLHETVLVLRRDGPPVDRQVLQAFADQIGVIIERQRLRREADLAEALAATNAVRTSLLRAVSHDLRTPLTSIKAAVSTLLQPDLSLTTDDTTSLLVSIDSSTDRLNRVVANLLDLSRLQTGSFELHLVPAAIEDLAANALNSIDLDTTRVELQLPPTVPMVRCDPPLLERVLANLITNAVNWNATVRAEAPVRVDALATGNDVQIRVVDHGPGIPHHQRARAFEPFQRLDDNAAHGGVGLGLAVAQGLTTAMGGTVELDDTPGGGLTVIVTLPRADQHEPPELTIISASLH